MTGKTFMKAVSNGRTDILQVLLDVLKKTGSPYCIIGGLAVNAYAEPVVSLDLDIVVATAEIDAVCRAAAEGGLAAHRFPHSVNLSSPESDLRIQLQTDVRYQDFIAGASKRSVLGYDMMVASLGHVLQGKIWAWSDESRRRSKRQKDLADILRLVETHPDLASSLPPRLRAEVE
jgi:hypothetical protein